MNALARVTTADLDREMVRRRGFREFTRRAWSQVEPAALVWGWHLDAMTEHLEAVVNDQITALVINVPPGCSKSLTVSTLFPAWVWIDRPDWRWIAASYSYEVATRDARRHRELVASDWWAARWPEVTIPTGPTASTAVGFFQNTRGGSRFTTTTRAAVTGQHGDAHLVDDPHDPQGVASTAELEATLTWWRETMPTRFRDPRHPRRVMVMQRLHEKDLSAELIREGATVLCLPMRHERAHPLRWHRDPRAEEGELLVPERYTADALAGLERRLGPRATAAQLQQRPAPAEGAVFRGEWLTRRWVELPEGGTWGLSLDAAFKAGADNDFVCLQVWYTVGANHYLVDQILGRLTFTETVAALFAMSARYPEATLKLVEDKANGPAILDALRDKLPGLVAVTPEGGKVARAHAVEPLFAAGQVWLPHEADARYPDGRRGAPWVSAYVHELTTFPAGANDDQVDATTQYLNHVARGGVELMRAAMDGARALFGGSR